MQKSSSVAMLGSRRGASPDDSKRWSNKFTYNVGNQNIAVYGEMVRYIGDKYGWEEVPADEYDCDLLMADSAATRRDPLLWSARLINQLPNANRYANKSYLAMLLNQSQRLFPGAYSFVPRTWDLDVPTEVNEFRQCFIEGQTYIVKPSGGRQGAGIKLIQSIESIASEMKQSRTGLTVQEYVDTPLLLDGYKFDLRIYVMIESLNPFRIHVFRDGLARLCTSKYNKPTSKNLHKAYMHLTNYSLNKDSENFKQNTAAADPADLPVSPSLSSTVDCSESELEPSISVTASDAPSANNPSSSLLDDDTSSKRSIDVAFKQLVARGVPTTPEELWKSIDDVIAKTCISLWPALLHSYSRQYSDPDSEPADPPSRCFHLMGFDILFDSHLKPWLLEINAAPSFAADSFLDLKIKKSVMEKSFEILGLFDPEKQFVRRSGRKPRDGDAEISISQQDEKTDAGSTVPSAVDDSALLERSVSALDDAPSSSNAGSPTSMSSNSRQSSSRRQSGRSAFEEKRRRALSARPNRSGRNGSVRRMGSARGKSKLGRSRSKKERNDSETGTTGRVKNTLSVSDILGDKSKSHQKQSRNKLLREEVAKVDTSYMTFSTVDPGKRFSFEFMFARPEFHQAYRHYVRRYNDGLVSTRWIEFISDLKLEPFLKTYSSTTNAKKNGAISRVDGELMFQKAMKGLGSRVTVTFFHFLRMLEILNSRVFPGTPPHLSMSLLSKRLKQMVASWE